MKKISYSGYRFPATIIQQTIWLYLRFTLSLRDVDDLLARNCSLLRVHSALDKLSLDPSRLPRRGDGHLACGGRLRTYDRSLFAFLVQQRDKAMPTIITNSELTDL